MQAVRRRLLHQGREEIEGLLLIQYKDQRWRIFSPERWWQLPHFTVIIIAAALAFAAGFTSVALC
jgi:hypothetical protein